MRTFKYCLLFLVICYSRISLAQEVPEPDFAMKPYFYIDGKLTELEKVDASLSKKIKAMGYGGVEFDYAVGENKSSIRFKKDLMPRIIIRSDDNSDPTEYLMLSKGESKRKSRSFKGFKMGMVGNTKPLVSDRIKIFVKKVKDKVYEFSFEQPLDIGEYAFIPLNSNSTMQSMTTGIKVYCFAVE